MTAPARQRHGFSPSIGRDDPALNSEAQCRKVRETRDTLMSEKFITHLVYV